MKNRFSENFMLTYKKKISFASVIIVGMVFGVYFNAVPNDFSNWDDNLVTANKTIQSLAPSNIKKIFTVRKGSTYQPVRTFSYAVDYYFWELNPVGYRLTNIALHSGAAVLLFLFLLTAVPSMQRLPEISLPEEVPVRQTKASGKKKKKKKKTNNKVKTVQSTEQNFFLVSFITALLFAVHPISVEAVTWIPGRKYVLLAFFSFAALYLFSFVLETGKLRYQTACFLSWILAMLSSPFGVTLPALFFLYDYARQASANPLVVLKQNFKIYLPYFSFYTVTIVVVWYTLFGGGTGGAVVNRPDDNVSYTVFTTLRTFSDYIRNLCLPLWLNPRYPNWRSVSFWEIKVVMSALGLCVTTVWLFFQVNKGKKFNLFCVGWFFISLAPVMQIIPISTVMADRYVYIGAVGFFLFMIVNLYQLVLYVNYRHVKTVACVLVACLIGWYSLLTVERNEIWSSSLSLWRDSLKKDPRGAIAHTNYASALFDAKRYSESANHFIEALKLKEDARGYMRLGWAMLMIKEYEKAIGCFNKSLEMGPVINDAKRGLELAKKVYAHESGKEKKNK